MPIHPRRRAGFTLIEIVVVVLIIGVLSAISVPMYVRTVESSKAENAAGVMKMMGTTNRMFMLDRSGNQANGNLSAGGATTNCSCPSGNCCVDTDYTACQLVYCKYLGSDNWGGSGYDFRVGNTACSSLACTSPNPAAGAGTIVACAKRCATGSAPCTGASSSYANWGYRTDANGTLVTCGGAPRPG